MFNEDLSAFFNTAEFADDAMLDGVEVAGIFDKQYLVEGGGMGFSATRPALTLPTARVPANPAGLPLLVNATNYIVAGIDADGSDRAVTVLLLELAP
ncbi:MAG TPA: hypothetical protein VGC21_21545 [Telluria sp.]|jgi:hypothetical protein